MFHSCPPIPAKRDPSRRPATIVLLASIAFGVIARAEQETTDAPDTETLEVVAKLQVFLDRADFSPGKIDGRMGQFTLEALALYRQAHGGAATPPSTAEAEIGISLPKLDDLDLTTVSPLFLSYEVSEDDLRQVGKLPGAVSEQAKLKTMPYRSAAEAIAEKFHMDQRFLEELNPGKTENILVGNLLKVVNVIPFEKSSVEALRPQTKQENPDEDQPDLDQDQSTLLLHINTETNMLTVRENDKLVAAYPVTVGSEQTESPEGEWKVTKISIMPNFRYDQSMLKKGVRSGDFHILPPGPNNPVGVIWIQLNKDGIGIHGTNDPETIGRASSHGCIRLANWDVVRLAARIGIDVPVSILAGSR